MITKESHEKAEEYDNLIKEVVRTVSEEKRWELTKQLQDIERDITVCCFLLEAENVYAMNSAIRDYYIMGTSLYLEKSYFSE